MTTRSHKAPRGAPAPRYDDILAARHLAEGGKGKVRGESKIWHLTDDQFVQLVEWIIDGVPAKRIEELCAQKLRLARARIPGRQAQCVFWKQFKPHWTAVLQRSPQPTHNSQAQAPASSGFTPVVILVPTAQLGALGGQDFAAFMGRLAGLGTNSVHETETRHGR